MGSHFTLIERQNQGFKVDPNQSPQYFHAIENGDCISNGENPRKRIDSYMSVVKVCSADADLLQKLLQNEFFSTWEENCNVVEYKGYKLSKLDTLLQKISDNFPSSGQNLHSKLNGIAFCSEVDVKIYEFTFEENLTSGVVHFGMVAISRENDVLEAISCLYTLNFKMADVMVTELHKRKILGFKAKTKRRCWDEAKSLEFVTQEDIVNFCRYKALKEFHKRNLVSNINDVSSLDGI